MGRAKTGTIELRSGRWWARVTLPDGSRPWSMLPAGLDEAEARALAAEMARRASSAAYVAAPKPAKVLTWSAWTAPWFASRRDRRMTSVDGDESRWKTWCGDLHALDVRAVTREHVEGLVRRLDKAIRTGALTWKSASNVWGLVRAMLRDMATSKEPRLRVRNDDPSAGVRGPDTGERAARVYLYPSEMLRLLSCEAVPVPMRCLYALAAYTYARAGELSALRWSDVDDAAGVIRLQRAAERRTRRTKSTKGGLARTIPIEPALVPLLRLLRGEDGEHVCRLESKGMGVRLREHLATAGITRAALFTRGPSERPITFHDLRATGVTWCALRGDDALRIQRRAGHAQLSTTQLYIREAEVLGSGVGEPFPALPPRLLLTLSSTQSSGTEKGAKTMGKTRLGMGASPMRKTVDTRPYGWAVDDIVAAETQANDDARARGRFAARKAYAFALAQSSDYAALERAELAGLGGGS